MGKKLACVVGSGDATGRPFIASALTTAGFETCELVNTDGLLTFLKGGGVVDFLVIDTDDRTQIGESVRVGEMYHKLIVRACIITTLHDEAQRIVMMRSSALSPMVIPRQEGYLGELHRLLTEH